ncbi:MAG: hypothetical protein ACLPVY_03725 [Acidimicrobiia bacterium]
MSPRAAGFPKHWEWWPEAIPIAFGRFLGVIALLYALEAAIARRRSVIRALET